jgi:hypothetical protein
MSFCPIVYTSTDSLFAFGGRHSNRVGAQSVLFCTVFVVCREYPASDYVVESVLGENDTVRWKVQAYLFKTVQVRIPGLTDWISVAHDFRHSFATCT